MLAYDSVDLANVAIFKKQMAELKTLLATCPPDKGQARDMDFLLSLGELFTLVAYGQLILESAAIQKIDDPLLDQIFDFMVRDYLTSRPRSLLYEVDDARAGRSAA